MPIKTASFLHHFNPRALTRLVLLWSSLCVLTSVSPSLAEGASAFTFSEPGDGITVSGTDGFQFTPLIDVVITSLGYYDRGQDGLAEVHPVALFQAVSGQQLAFALVSNTSLRRGNFRFEPIQPVILKASETYVVAGFTSGNSDPPADNPKNLNIAPQIGYNGYLFDFGDRFALPTRRDLFGERTFFGPNFEFHAAPELLSFSQGQSQRD